MFAKSLIVSLTLAVSSVHAALYISTPTELKQCEEATFVITGANGPVWPFVVDPKAPCDDPLRELKDVTGDLKWKPDLPVGTSVQIAIEDEAGNEGWSGALTIMPGSDSSCVTSNPSSTPSNPAVTPATPAAPTSSSPGPSILGGVDTPQNAANAPGAAPRHAASSLTVLTVLSTLALALAL